MAIRKMVSQVLKNQVERNINRLLVLYLVKTPLILIIRVKFINLIGNMEDNIILKQQVI